MAIIKSGINGAFSGKVGPVVGYERFGKATMRALPRESKKNKKGSDAQNEKRSIFRNMQRFMAPILPLIRMGFGAEGRRRQMTAHNAAMSYNLSNAITQEGEIGYNKILISYGHLLGGEDVALAQDDTGIHLSWKNNSSEPNAESFDQVVVLIYNVDLKRTYRMGSGARRSVGQESIELPSNLKDVTLHVWVSFISDDRERVSMSSYVGACVF